MKRYYIEVDERHFMDNPERMRDHVIRQFRHKGWNPQLSIHREPRYDSLRTVFWFDLPDEEIWDTAGFVEQEIEMDMMDLNNIITPYRTYPKRKGFKEVKVTHQDPKPIEFITKEEMIL